MHILGQGYPVGCETSDPPDVEAAEDGKEESREDGDWNSQQDCDDPVDPHPSDLKQGITPHPHPVSTTH